MIDIYRDRMLYPYLSPSSREAVDQLLLKYPFTFQELRLLCEYARDLDMWQAQPIGELWQAGESRWPETSISVPVRKKKVFDAVRAEMKRLRSVPKSYESGVRHVDRTRKLSPVVAKTEKNISGACPVASPKTVCCNLKTIDAVENCAYACSYCTIQTFYGDRVTFHADLADKLKQISIHPERFYHFGTGQSSDALVWGNKNGMLDDLCAFAGAHPNILLEFKTKSANVAYFETHQIPRNVVCSWSLNPDAVIRNEEHGTASLSERIEAAARVAACGVKVAFHFHPMVYYDRWDVDYDEIACRVLERFLPEDVLFISFGSVTFIKPAMQAIRKRGQITKILQMEMIQDPHGKWTYPDVIKVAQFSRMWESFSKWRERVLMYLCMERADIWDQVFGRHYETNEAFESDFGRRTMSKLRPVEVMS